MMRKEWGKTALPRIRAPILALAPCGKLAGQKLVLVAPDL
jgi:hypothetical protein